MWTFVLCNLGWLFNCNYANRIFLLTSSAIGYKSPWTWSSQCDFSDNNNSETWFNIWFNIIFLNITLVNDIFGYWCTRGYLIITVVKFILESCFSQEDSCILTLFCAWSYIWLSYPHCTSRVQWVLGRLRSIYSTNVLKMVTNHLNYKSSTK